MDVNNAFLNDDLDKIVYMKQPTGLEQGSGLVYKLKKASMGSNRPFGHGIKN